MADLSTSDPSGVTGVAAEVVAIASATNALEEKRIGSRRKAADDETNGHGATEGDVISATDGEVKGRRIPYGEGPGDDGADGRDPTLALERTKKEGGKQKAVSFIQLFKYADRLDLIFIIVGALGAAVTGAAQPLMTVVFGSLINAFGSNVNDTGKLISTVSNLALDFVYIGIGSAIASYLEVTCFMIAAERQSARIRTMYLRAVLRQDVAFFDTDTSTGEVITRMSGDTVLVQDAMGEKAGKFIQLFVTFAGGYIVAFIKSWKLTLVVMSVMPIVVIAGGTTAVFISKMSNRAQAAYAEAGNLVEQVIGSIRTVASFTGEKKAVQDYGRDLQKAERAGIWQSLVTGGGFGFVLGTMFSTYGLALWYGSTLVLHEGLTGGRVINVIFAVLMGAMSLAQASPSMSAIAIGRAAAYKIFETIERNPPIDVYDMSGLVPDKIKGDVELQNVSFCYPTRPDVAVFSDFSLTIPSGKTVALVGESGSGKSTVVSLIERFYDPQSGVVLVDGMDIRTIQLKWLRQQIGLVSQEPVLFSTSIKENIAYGNHNATMGEIEMAATLANAAQFINKVPQGYDTMVGERGIQLSGGQKQRVAIARAILKNPRILLLDEATSALDAQSERVVQDALDRIMTDRTTVVIAHRLTTIRNADMIAVVERGVIVETGTHDELIHKPDGAYSQLVRLQEVHRRNDRTGKTVEDPDYVPEPEETTILKRDSGHVSSRKSGSLFGSMGLNREGSVRSRSSGVADDVENGKREEVNEEKGESRSVVDVSLMRLVKLNQPELPLFLLGSFAAAASGLVFPVFGLLLSSVINAFFEPPEKLKKDVAFWAEMFVVLGIGVGLATPGRTFTFGIIGERLIRRVRKLTFENIVRQEIGWFDEEANSSGAISSRLSSDAAAVRGIVGDALSLLAMNIATIVAGIVIAFTASWQLALVVLAVVPLLALQSYIQIKWMKGFAQVVKEKYEDASRLATDAVSSIRTVASFVAEERICNLYNEECKRPVKNGIKQSLIAGIALGFSNFILYTTFALCFWVGGKLVQDGTLTFKDVFRVFFAISMSTNSVTQSSGMAPDFAKARIAVNSIFAIVDRKSKIDPTDMSGQILKDSKGEIEFERVAFFYPTRPDVQIFRELSFKVQAGQTLALVGESGSGKSTVVSLLERFYEPQSGTIYIDRVNIQKLQLKWLRQQIGLVSQEPVLFDENVDWNIVYGKEGKVSEAEIQAAAEAANAHKFISALPEGYKTRVGERGTQLSGGQKQRVAIARSILKDPKILLLDEATSALDAESEHVVQEALDRIMVHRTTIVIAHRLSTVRNADIIAVVKNGAIVEQGTHSELLDKDGAYAALVKLHAT
ncbi:unnamed protein product [Calypogeia fissa]